MRNLRSRAGCLGVVAGTALVLAPAALAHARVSPSLSLAHQSQLYSLVVPTEKANVTTRRVTLTVPSGFGIDSFVPARGWTQHVSQTGSGENAVVQTVTWTGGHTPTGEDALFQFLAVPESTGTYTFGVEQTYSDGSVVDWSGPESSDTPAPTVEARSSLGGGGGAGTLTIVALVLAAVALLVAIGALVAVASKRPIA